MPGLFSCPWPCEFVGLGPPLCFSAFFSICSPLSPPLGPSLSSPHQCLSSPWAPVPRTAWAGRWHGVVGGGGPGGGPFIQCSLLFSSAFSSQGPPAPTNTISPSPTPLPPCSLPASLPSSSPPSSLPPSLHLSPPPPPPPPALQDPARAGRRRPRRGEGAVVAAVVAAGRQQGGKPGWGHGAAGGYCSQGTRVRGQALPPRAGRPRDTPPSSAFPFHLLLSILSSHLVPPPRLPPSWSVQGCQLPCPRQPGHCPASPGPQACFSRGD